VRKALLALALVALAGCGGGSESGGSGSKPGPASIVDPNGNPPLVNSLEVEPGTGKLLVTTNRGFFRVDPKGGDAERISGAAIAKGRSVPVGGFLEVLPTGPRTLLGSGHPDRKGVLPEFLGVMRSEDAGRTWTVIARLGEADLHRMVLKGGKLYAFDAGRRRQVAPARACPRHALRLAGGGRALPRGRRREHLGLGRRRGQLEAGRPRAGRARAAEGGRCRAPLRRAQVRGDPRVGGRREELEADLAAAARA
jgi:hypothetical protein